MRLRTARGFRRLIALVALAALLPACGAGGGSGTLTPTVAPGIPEDVEVRSGNRSATITWSASAAGAVYTVHRSLNPKGPFFPVSVPGGFRTPTTYVDSGLINGTSYYYQVRASNAFGESPPSASGTATPDFKPTAVSGSPGGSAGLALLADGSVWEWGQTVANTSSPVPVQVANLIDITAISAGRDHHVALASDGTVWSWGNNSSGQVGPGVPVGPGAAVPVPVPGIANVIGIASGEAHSLAVLADGTVWGWGSKQLVLGSGAPEFTSTIVQVPGLAGIIAIDAGFQHNLAVRSDGLLFTWGGNPNGELGLGSVTAGVTPPTQVPNLTGVTAVSAGVFHSLALRGDGTVWGWGQNTQGQLGIGNMTSPITVPSKSPTLSNMVHISAGGAHSLGVRNDGTAWSWGINLNGQLGNGASGASVATPVQVQTLHDAVSVAASSGNGFALTSDGSLWSWGSNSGGSLGNGSGVSAQIPVEMPNFTGALGIAAGTDTSAAIRGTGTVWSWGLNNTGQFGSGASSATPTPTPAQATGVTTAVQIASGYYHSLARLSGGTVMAWGNNSFAQVGNGAAGAPVLTPITVPGLSGISKVFASSLTSFAIKSDQTLWVWGNNSFGSLGNGTQTAPVGAATQVPSFTGVVSVAAGDRHVIAAKSDGTVWVWGGNDLNQLGLGAVGTMTTPTQVPGITNAMAVGAGYFHCLVVRTDGTVTAWGEGSRGELGDGLKTSSNVPVSVPGLTDVASVAGGPVNSYALRNDGTVWSWGDNVGGQLGNAVPDFSAVPVQVLELTDVVEISIHYSHCMARLSNGTIRSWGGNGSSQLGVPLVTMSTTPVPVTR